MYPIHRLNRNITRIFHDIVSTDMPGDISNGLDNEIHFIDEDGHITDVAYIANGGIDGISRVYLSSAYCQYLWLLCDVALKDIDFFIIKEESHKVGLDLNGFKKAVEQTLCTPIERIITMVMQCDSNVNPTQYVDYLKRVLQLLDENVYKQQRQNEINMAVSLRNNSRQIDSDKINELDIDGLYEQKTNSVYCFGVAFILLHELSHFELSHLSKNVEREDEEAADYSAFWNIYSDINDDRMFSANVGIICALFSLMMINPDLDEDKIHPREDTRLFAFYELMKGDNPKYAVLMKELLDIWGTTYAVKDYPMGLSDTETGLYQIRDFIKSDCWKTT